MPSKIFPKSALVITHYFTTGPGMELRDFLRTKVSRLYYISHPFPFANGDIRSTYTSYKNDRIHSEKKFVWVPKKYILTFIKDVLATIIFGIFINEKIEICVSCDNLNTLAALFLKKIGKIKTVVYYNIDYTPQRFTNKFLNSIYHYIDRFCLYNADCNWIGTIRTTEARKINGVNIKKMKKTFLVPDGNHSKSIQKKQFHEINKYTMVFVGHILKKQGLDIVIESLPALIRNYPKISLIVIGQGEYLSKLKQKAKKLNVNKYIDWKGYVENHSEIENIIVSSAVALAPYIPDGASVTNYSEAGKPKLYLGCGVPVILTDVPSIAKNIQRTNSGIVIKYSQSEFANAIDKMFSNTKNYLMIKENAIRLGNRFDWSTIFTKTFSDMKKNL